MKTTILTMFLCLALTTVQAQRNRTLDEISAGWKNKTITGVTSGNIIPLLTAFNKTWRTESGTALLKDGMNPMNQDDGYHFVVDRQNGYVSASELGDDGEDISACVWKRSNGHKLFAVVLTKYHGVFPAVKAFFYDYNPTKQTLTPEPNEVTEFVPSFTESYGVDAVSIKLPQYGKTVEIGEYIMGWSSHITHTYEWTGMKPRWTATTMEKLQQMKQLYTLSEPNFTKYCLIDIDQDNIPEVWLLSENNDNQAIYSLANNKVSLLASTYFKTHFSFLTHGANAVILTAGGCGTGCFSAEYTAIENSKVKFRLNDLQSYDYQKDDMISSYSLNDKEISTDEGKRMVDTFGEPEVITPNTRSFYR